MNTNPHLQAVVEASLYQGGSLCPWPIANCQPFSFIRLSGKMTDREVGLVFAQLVMFNHLESNGDTNNVLHQVIQAEKLILPGGLQVRSAADQVISPSCCCGLETWRDWLRFAETGASPWLGHDPSPWVEKVGGLVRVWSGEKSRRISHKKGANVFHIDFEQSKFEAELSKVQQDLSAFLVRIEAWADRVGFAEPSKLSRKFDECFHISSWPRLLPRGRSPRFH
jgi:hypothetical protein